MTALTRWEPFRELMTLQDRLNRMFNEPYGSLGPITSQDALTGGAFMPPVDVYEDEHSIRLKMEVPGIDEKDIDIRLENNMLTVRGERKLESETKQENYHRIERNYGSFTRSFSLPSTVNPEDVKANYSWYASPVSAGTIAPRLGRERGGASGCESSSSSLHIWASTLIIWPLPACENPTRDARSLPASLISRLPGSLLRSFLYGNSLGPPDRQSAGGDAACQ